MSAEEFRQKLAEMTAKIAIMDAQLMANPKPYLVAMENYCIDLLETLEKVEYALSPDCVFDFWDENCNKKIIQRPNDIQGEAYIRCTKALEVLQEYRDKKANKDYRPKR